MKLGVLGYGVVGRATELQIKRKFDVIVDLEGYDEFKHLYDCDIVFVCLPSNDYSDVEQLFDLVGKIADNTNYECEIVIRTTVTPGTMNRLSQKFEDTPFVYWPEFLREATVEEDVRRSPILFSHSEKLIRILLPDNRYSFEMLEIIKIMGNVWSCAQITFANHMHQLCEEYDVEYDHAKYVMKCTRLSRYDEGGRPFGGKCLPKDLDLLIQEFRMLQLDQDFFTAIKRDNSRF